VPERQARENDDLAARASLRSTRPHDRDGAAGIVDGVSDFELPITTGLELPGLVVRENLGVTFGLVVRSMGFARNFTAGFKSLRQGEVSEYTDLLEDARRHAIDRMVANAKLLGANGIVAMRFDSSEMGNQLTEVVAYGTAVVVERAGS
jgi:uncharacterized protein YbjQ (UPF0145 family)